MTVYLSINSLPRSERRLPRIVAKQLVRGSTTGVNALDKID